MGGGGAVRAAAKVAGINVLNAGIRGGSLSSSSTEQCVKNVSRPVSTVISSSAPSGDAVTSVQRPALQLDEWEFAGGVEDELDILVNGGEPLPRVVFGGGGAPSLQEAKAATAELKDAINKVYLSSAAYAGSVGSFRGAQQSGLPLLAKSDNFDTKSCITCNPKDDVPKDAMMAFSLLNESPVAQSVVASIACDPNVWDAVLKNESLQEFLQSQRANAVTQDLPSPWKSADQLLHNGSQGENSDTESSYDSNPDGIFNSEPMEFLNNVKQSVTKMVSNVAAYLQNIFGFSSVEKPSSDPDENIRPTFVEKSLGASFIGLAMLVIMVVLVKRG